jgi:glycosyltransferase involved in cell wall biosynthesis
MGGLTDRKLSVLMICHKSRAGAFARSHAMARELVLRGHRVALLLVSPTQRFGFSEFDWDGVRAVNTPDLLWGRLRTGWDIWNTLSRILYLNRDEESYDLIHCFETRPATIYPALYYARRHGVPWLTDWNDWWGRGGLIEVNRPLWYRFLLGWLETYYEEAFRVRANGLTVISKALERRAIDLGVRPERICRIPGGTFPEWFQGRSKEECRKQVGFPLAVPLLGFSSISQHLDMEIVLAALAIVARAIPSVQLIVTGNARREVHELAKTHGVEGNVRFVGHLPYEDLPWYLGCADVFLLPFPDRPYNVGRWPNKLGDYMSLGRPTVSNPVGDIEDLFESHAIGCLAAWHAQDFADKIIFLLENPRISTELGRSARKVAVEEYDWRILAGKLEGFYFRVLDSLGNRNRT